MSQLPFQPKSNADPAPTIVSTANGLPNGEYQRLFIKELSGPSPITIALKGGVSVLIGAEFSSEARGSVYVPLGSSRGIATVTGITFDKTEFGVSWDAAFMRADTITLLNVDVPITPEGLLEAFTTLQKRGRECLVQLAYFVRTGVLRKVTPKPNRGYLVDVQTSSAGSPGVNIDATIQFDWTSDRGPTAPTPTGATGTGTAGKLASLASVGALADIDALAPSFLDQINAGIGNLRSAASNLRSLVKGLGDLAQTPGNLINGILAAARSLGNVANDLMNVVNDTAAEYQAIGGTLASVGNKLKAQRTGTSVRAACQTAKDSVADIFDAIDKRRASKTVAVSPGQSLGQIAKQYLGSSDRWPEISDANNLTGQMVPAGVYTLTIPAS